MLRSGHDIPDYSDSNATSVVLRLNSAQMDERFICMLVNEEKRINRLMPLDALIILSALKNERRAKLADLAQKVQKRESDVIASVERLVELGMIDSVGNGKAQRYMLSSKVYELSGNKTGYTRQRGMTTLQEMDLICRHIDSFGKISRAEVVELCRRNSDHAYYLLQKLATEKRIVSVKKGRSSIYVRETFRSE